MVRARGLKGSEAENLKIFYDIIFRNFRAICIMFKITWFFFWIRLYKLRYHCIAVLHNYGKIYYIIFKSYNKQIYIMYHFPIKNNLGTYIKPYFEQIIALKMWTSIIEWKENCEKIWKLYLGYLEFGLYKKSSV